MGTSASSRGTNGAQPLVPSWADDQPNVKLPIPEHQRFRAFRTTFGKAVANGGDKSDIKKALGHYARTATGGNSVGPRRFGNIYTAGGSLYSALQSLAGSGSLPDFSSNNFVGKPLDQLSQALGELLSGDTPDADRINVAVQEAVANVLDIENDFDPAQLTGDAINAILSEFLALSVFQSIVEEVGGAWDRSDDVKKTADCESNLLDLIRAIVDTTLHNKFKAGSHPYSQDSIKKFMRETVKSVWTEWESYQ
ncbi:hypothetical protein [Brucella thiophenivorans]|uniref:Uncharacterized protein n=1 Tax=Brucella thiophenivorans TaxID=571255 RepID=A0A256FL64_9HYPH|nr:hypothetical protein [Brucella thiophenivorans]OYR15171.1 hypothetical protein CEV31_3184 [Brucella thiophenivorans]